MIAALFQHRSGRVIALCRALMALVFFLALWIDPAQPVRASELGYVLIGSYLALSVALMAVAMTSWWWDHRLAWPVLAIDVLAFLAAVFFTEGVNDDFTSPFLAFFAFLMLAATIRWDWRVTAITGLTVTALYLAVGLVLSVAQVDFDQLRFGRRIAYMMVLALILIWFGLQRREQHIDRFIDSREPGVGLAAPLEEALAYAVLQTGGHAGAIAWSEGEEPTIEVRTIALPSPGAQLVPGQLPDERPFGDRVRLFSANRNRTLQAGERSMPEANYRPINEPLADLLGMGEALALPFAGGTGRGEIMVTGIAGVCADHVAIGQLIAREVAAGFDRHATLVLSHQTALARSREALARDLHDNVAQSLAGAALRLEGMRKSIQAGHDPETEILQLKSALRTEQQQVREMIERLRHSDRPISSMDLSASLRRLAGELSANWGVAIDFESTQGISVNAPLAHEVGSIVREAVANAVRHGQARRMTIDLRVDHSWVIVGIADDGSGFAPGTGSDAPRSIRERVARRLGTFAVDTSSSGTRLAIRLPLGDEI